jgi:Divergent InlB B-repeat domain
MMKILIFAVSLCLLILATNANAAKGDALSGQRLYLALCETCHGATPDRRAKLAADDPDFLRLTVFTSSGMGFLQSILTTVGYENIAAYIGNKALNENLVTVALSGNGAGSVNSNPNGIACGGTCEWTYPIGAAVSLRAEAKQGSRFVGWSGACASAGLGDCRLTVNGGVTTFANFVRHTADADLSGLWWSGAAENGWGVSITHRAESGQKFVALYIYESNGEPTWYVMPGGTWSENFTVFKGDIYQPRGTRLDQYNRDALVIGAAKGEMTLRVISANAITLQYRIDGSGSNNSGTKQLLRQQLAGENLMPTSNVGDLWWAGESENGWGLSIAQQADTLFAVWYSYDVSGRPIWHVMPGGEWRVDSTGRSYTGTLFKTTGAAWIGTSYDPTRLQISPVGSLRLSVDMSLRPSMINMQYQLSSGEFSGVNQAKSLLRQAF